MSVGARLKRKFVGFGTFEGEVIERIGDDKVRIAWDDGSDSVMKSTRARKFVVFNNNDDDDDSIDEEKKEEEEEPPIRRKLAVQLNSRAPKRTVFQFSGDSFSRGTHEMSLENPPFVLVPPLQGMRVTFHVDDDATSFDDITNAAISTTTATTRVFEWEAPGGLFSLSFNARRSEGSWLLQLKRATVTLL